MGAATLITTSDAALPAIGKNKTVRKTLPRKFIQCVAALLEDTSTEVTVRREAAACLARCGKTEGIRQTLMDMKAPRELTASGSLEVRDGKVSDLIAVAVENIECRWAHEGLLREHQYGLRQEYDGREMQVRNISLEDRVKERQQRMRKVFNDFDDDRSGLVTLQEFQAALKLLENFENVTNEQAAEAFNEADEDGNGTIDYFEFCEMIDGRLRELDDAVLTVRAAETGLTMLQLLHGMKKKEPVVKRELPANVVQIRKAADLLHKRNREIDQSVQTASDECKKAV